MKKTNQPATTYKKPLNKYIKFFVEVRPMVVAQYPSYSPQEITKKIGELYRETKQV